MKSTCAVSTPDECGVLRGASLRIGARHGARAYAGVNIAFCEDGLFRISIDLQYSYGGFCGPVFISSEEYHAEAAAETGGIEKLLRKWPKAFPSEPAGVHEELNDARRQIEARLSQSCLL